MITAIDSSILIDVGLGASERAPAAIRSVEECAAQGPIVVCDVALVEVVPVLSEMVDPAAWFRDLGIAFDPVGEKAAIHAGRLHTRYLKRTKSRRRLVVDLLIGAHALFQADQLLSRDRGYYRDYFQGLKLVEPR